MMKILTPQLPVDLPSLEKWPISKPTGRASIPNLLEHRAEARPREEHGFPPGSLCVSLAELAARSARDARAYIPQKARGPSPASRN